MSMKEALGSKVSERGWGSRKVTLTLGDIIAEELGPYLQAGKLAEFPALHGLYKGVLALDAEVAARNEEADPQTWN